LIRATGNSSNFATCYLFVDGAYVRERRTEHGLGLEFDPRGPVSHLAHRVRILGRHPALVRCFYFDAVDEDNPEMVAFIEKVKGLDDTHVYLGRIVGDKGRRRQKGVDIQLAIEALKVARSGNADVIAIVTGDQDFMPLVEAIRDEGPMVFVFAFKDNFSVDLLNAADRKHVFDDFDGSWTFPKGA